MSDEKHTTSHHDIEQGITRTMTTVTLTPEQFEALYLQPKTGVHNGLVRRVANAAPLSVISLQITSTNIWLPYLTLEPYRPSC